MDESGLAGGTRQSSRVLVNIRDKVNWKVLSGRQELVATIKCVDATGQALPPLVITPRHSLDPSASASGMAFLDQQERLDI